MKFPGKRKSKHYFPVNARDPLLQQFQPENETSAAWVVGIDQTLVDIEAKVDDEFIERYGLSAGHSLVIEDDVAEALYQELKQKNLITHQFAGGTIGNTMHNYSVLADDRSVLLGVMCSNIEIGSYAYRYLCNTSSRTDLNYLQGVDGPIGRCFTLIGESGERTFAISPGHMNQLRAESIPEDVIAGASAMTNLVPSVSTTGTLYFFAYSMAFMVASGMGSPGLQRTREEVRTRAEAPAITSSGILSARSWFMWPGLIAKIRSPDSPISVKQRPIGPSTPCR